jgi:hypothetical protein
MPDNGNPYDQENDNTPHCQFGTLTSAPCPLPVLRWVTWGADPLDTETESFCIEHNHGWVIQGAIQVNRVIASSVSL